MVTLESDALVFRFPEVHEAALLRVEFQRTLRIPDDDKEYPLPPGLGAFPLRHVDDFASGVPEAWLKHGGVMMPMYQSEAMWLSFQPNFVRGVSYPFAVKIASGKINAVTGDDWSDGLTRHPQDYLVSPEQPWLDGFCVSEGIIRQFVAMPLGRGYTVEEQLSGAAEFGGVQIVAYPMKGKAFEKMLEAKREEEIVHYCMAAPCASAAPDMGLAPGGKMRQEIYDDPYDFNDWNRNKSSRCFVHLANSVQWQAIACQEPPTMPPTAKDYTKAWFPWFDFYDDKHQALQGSERLNAAKSVTEMAKMRRQDPLPENESATITNVKHLRRGLAKNQVREGTF